MIVQSEIFGVLLKWDTDLTDLHGLKKRFPVSVAKPFNESVFTAPAHALRGRLVRARRAGLCKSVSPKFLNSRNILKLWLQFT